MLQQLFDGLVTRQGIFIEKVDRIFFLVEEMVDTRQDRNVFNECYFTLYGEIEDAKARVQTIGELYEKIKEHGGKEGIRRDAYFLKTRMTYFDRCDKFDKLLSSRHVMDYLKEFKKITGDGYFQRQ